ncbi:hypothetical protein SAMN00790413_04477 [Deinococcus hopiensis KR-140]|uniref:Uncharacterized protein n=2 Tax=Deinococcus TaxID=1298 RepID=A0A1W1UJ58_9DEIO|nr:hypothetical protein SAMN00790413_04477 [Deinococcus hopiensis KR-140]
MVWAWRPEGQYIIKNLVLIAGALVVGAMWRGGALIADPKAEWMQALHASFTASLEGEFAATVDGLNVLNRCMAMPASQAWAGTLDFSRNRRVTMVTDW